MPDTDQNQQLPAFSPPTSRDMSAEWSQRGIGRNWQHRFFYWLIRLGGRARGYHMAHIVTFWYVLFYPSIRKRCRFYLDRRFPDRRGALRRWLDTYRLVRTYGSTLVDMMVLDILGPRALAATCPDHDRLVQLTAGERGFVLIHAHVGCWQIGMSALGQFPKRVSIVMLPEPKMESLVDRHVADTIDPRAGLGSAMRMAEVLLRGEIVAMMGDRTFGNDQHVVAARFLGGQALFPITPYRLASATGMPVLVMTAPRIDGNRYELRLAKIIEVPPGLGRDPRNYAPYAQLFADCIEQFVGEYPWQFYNFYDFWREADKEIDRETATVPPAAG
jgi:predicted LPLAT superfamily acyltransferase